MPRREDAIGGALRSSYAPAPALPPDIARILSRLG